MKPLLLLLLALPASAATYDCSQPTDKAALEKAADQLWKDDKALYRRVSAALVENEGIKCSIFAWCVGRRANVKLALDSATPVIVLNSVPSSPCSGAWTAGCSEHCGHVTEPLNGSDASKAIWLKDPQGAVTLSKGAKWSLAQDGLAFDWGGSNYVAQYSTRFIFRDDAGKQVDTGVTLDEEVWNDACAGKCGRSCAASGLKAKGKRFSDERGGVWADDSASECKRKK